MLQEQLFTTQPVKLSIVVTAAYKGVADKSQVWHSVQTPLINAQAMWTQAVRRLNIADQEHFKTPAEERTCLFSEGCLSMNLIVGNSSKSPVISVTHSQANCLNRLSWCRTSESQWSPLREEGRKEALMFSWYWECSVESETVMAQLTSA